MSCPFLLWLYSAVGITIGWSLWLEVGHGYRGVWGWRLLAVAVGLLWLPFLLLTGAMILHFRATKIATGLISRDASQGSDALAGSLPEPSGETSCAGKSAPPTSEANCRKCGHREVMHMPHVGCTQLPAHGKGCPCASFAASDTSLDEGKDR